MNIHSIIYYRGGLYGTFIEWCLNYFSDPTFSSQLPFTAVGNAHKFFGSGAILSEKMFATAVEKKYKFTRMHPGSTNLKNYKLSRTPKQTINCYRNELSMIEKISKYTIFLYTNIDNVLWAENNLIKSFEKETKSSIEYYKENEVPNVIFAETIEEYIIKNLSDCCQHLIKNWGKKHIADMDIWELREFLSLYLYGSWHDIYNIFDILKQEFPNVIFIDISDLRDNFENTIVTLFTKLNLQIIRNDFNLIYRNWYPLQVFKNRDKEIEEIVDKTLKNIPFEWNSLTIIDEAEIQRQLRINGWEIRCFDLNNFPVTVTNLRSLLYKD